MERLKQKISACDLIYHTPSRCWQDGFTIGNGAFCALAYETEGMFPTWLLNLNTLWDERCSEFKRFSLPYLKRIASGELSFVQEMGKENPPPEEKKVPVPVYGANLRIEPGISSTMAPGHKIKKHLHLFDGYVETSLTKHLSHPVIESFICAGENVMVIRVRNVSCLTAFRQQIYFYRDSQPEYPSPDFILEEDGAAFEQTAGDLKFSAAVLVKSRPDQKVMNEEIFFKYTHSVTELPKQSLQKTELLPDCAGITVCGNYDIFVTLERGISPVELMKKLRSVSEKGSEALFQEHKKYWNSFWEKNDVSFKDPGLNQLWCLSNYHMGIASNVNPAWGLCGPWFGRTGAPAQVLPWNGYYTNDYNSQLPLMPLENINRPELAEGLLRMIHAQLGEAGKNAEILGMPGAFYPLSCGPDGKDCSSGHYRLCQGAGPYWGILVYRHYCYTGDLEFLKEIGYDILREVSRFFSAYIEWDDSDDTYHLRCSQNPELHYLHLQDPIDTLALLKATLKAAVEISVLLDRDEDDRNKWEHILAHYPEYPTSPLGFSPLKGLPENHINHSRTLAPLFPAGELDPEFPGGQLEDAKREIYSPTWNGFMHSWACNDGTIEGWTGKVYHRGIPACRIGDKALAWKYLCDLISGCVKPNGLISHNMAVLSDSVLTEENIGKIPFMEIVHDCGPVPVSVAEVSCGRCWEDATEDPECKEKMYPVLEGPAVFLLLVSEMLLQGYHGLVRLFPAMPDDQDVSFRDLRTEGPLLVSAARKNGVVQYVRIKALKKQSFLLLNPWEDGQEVCLNGKMVRLEHHHPFELDEMEEVVLQRSEQISEKTDVFNTVAEARLLMPDGCRGAFLGKPSQAEYYAGLEKIRSRQILPENK